MDIGTNQKAAITITTANKAANGLPTNNIIHMMTAIPCLRAGTCKQERSQQSVKQRLKAGLTCDQCIPEWSRKLTVQARMTIIEKTDQQQLQSAYYVHIGLYMYV